MDSITHLIDGIPFTTQTIWLKEFGPHAFYLIYSVGKKKVSREEYLDALENRATAEQFSRNPDLSPFERGAVGD